MKKNAITCKLKINMCLTRAVLNIAWNAVMMQVSVILPFGEHYLEQTRRRRMQLLKAFEQITNDDRLYFHHVMVYTQQGMPKDGG